MATESNGGEEMTKRWRELAEKAASVSFERELLAAIEQAIETAVAEERARMEIKWPIVPIFIPRDFESSKKGNPDPALVTNVVLKYLREHAKIGVRDE